MARKSIVQKIRALKNKTVQNGCTEAEALAAAAMAARLMAEHQLSEQSINITESASRSKEKGRSSIGNLWSVIAWCTNTKCIVLGFDNGTLINFVGRDPGPEIAIYLREVCERAIQTELKKFRSGKFYQSRRKQSTKRAASKDFTEGMVIRLCTRLMELFEDTHDDAACDEANYALQESYSGSLPVKQHKRKERYSQAGNSGWWAGGTVALNHGVNGGNETQALGDLR